MVYDEARARTMLVVGTGTGGAQTWEYDGASWQQGPTTPAVLGGRAGAVMVYRPDTARTWLFGGWDGQSSLDDTWEYDGSAWTPGPPSPARTA